MHEIVKSKTPNESLGVRIYNMRYQSRYLVGMAVRLYSLA